MTDRYLAKSEECDQTARSSLIWLYTVHSGISIQILIVNMIPCIAPDKMLFYTSPQGSGGVLWFHVGCPCVHPSVHPSVF